MAKTAIPEPSGKPTTSRFSAETGTVHVSDADAAIAPLLHRAMTMKMRGEWEEAITVATDAVRRAPASAAAHALIGDIYAAQNNSDDALHWYRMALARNPQDATVAQKHELLLTQKRAAITGEYSTVTLSSGQRDSSSRNKNTNTTTEITANKAPVLTAKLPLSSATAERTLEWLDRVFPPGRSEGMARLLFTISGIVALLVAITGAFIYFGSNKNDTDTDSSLAVGGISTVATSPAVPATSPPVDALPPSQSVPPTPQDSAPTATATPPATKELLKELNHLQDSEVTVASAQTDASKIQVQLELAITPHAGETAGATRDRVLIAATTVARASSLALPSLQRFSVRVLMKANSHDASIANSSLVFIGETSHTALQVASNSGTEPNLTLLASLFTNTWWSNGLTPTANP